MILTTPIIPSVTNPPLLDSEVRVVNHAPPKCGYCGCANHTGTNFCSTWCKQEWQRTLATFEEFTER